MEHYVFGDIKRYFIFFFRFVVKCIKYVSLVLVEYSSFSCTHTSVYLHKIEFISNRLRSAREEVKFRQNEQ